VTITIQESQMSFGPYDQDHVFRPEESATYARIKNGLKIGDLVLLQENNDVVKLLLIEAKSSTPRPLPAERFEAFICEIREKLTNTLAMILAALMNRPGSAHDEVPVAFTQLAIATLDILLVLVIRGHPKAWLPPLRDALANALQPTVKIWGIAPPAVFVLNDDLARDHHLLV